MLGSLAGFPAGGAVEACDIASMLPIFRNAVIKTINYEIEVFKRAELDFSSLIVAGSEDQSCMKDQPRFLEVDVCLLSKQGELLPSLV